MKVLKSVETYQTLVEYIYRQKHFTIQLQCNYHQCYTDRTFAMVNVSKKGDDQGHYKTYEESEGSINQ